MPTTIVIDASNAEYYFTASGRNTNNAESPTSGNVYELSGNLSFNTNVYMDLGEGEIFDGKGFTIDMSGVNGTFNGLFTTGGSSLSTGSKVTNVGVLGGTIGFLGGAIIKAEQRYFTVENCYSTGTIGQQAGGIAGRDAGNNGTCTITSCYSTGPIGTDAGGIAGRDAGNNGTCTITSCYSTGPIGQQAGGIVGFSAGNNGVCTITSCYSTGDIGTDAGGIAGRAAGDSSGNCTITSCYSTGDIGLYAGGITGTNSGAQSGNCTITSCYSTGDIGRDAGGIAGRFAGAGENCTCTITSCYSTGDIGQFAGGITGSDSGAQSGNCTITSCYSTGDIDMQAAGGIAGVDAGAESGTCTVSKSFSNRKDGNLTNGVSDGTNPMDGNFILPQRPFVDDSLDAMLSDLSAVEWIEDTFPPKEYPLLKSFTEAPWNSDIYALKDGNIVTFQYQNYDTVNPEIPGCMNSASLQNYTSTATVDNGSCVFPTTIVIHSGNKDKYFTSTGRVINESVPEASGNVYELSENLSFSTNVFMNLSAGETFNGKGFTIDMSGVSDTFNGLFITGGESFENGSIVKNVGVLGGTIGFLGGAIIRSSQRYFTVENCYSTGNINGIGAGGIAGLRAANSGIATNLGGECLITSCYSTGDIDGIGAGGIAGQQAGQNGVCTITSCYSTGTIGQNAGGIVGRLAGYNIGVCTITSCYSTGPIGTDAGGIVERAAGQNGVCTITSCYSTGDIGSGSGGIAGRAAGNSSGNCTITSCYSTGPIGQQAGGIVGSFAGHNNGTCTVSKSFSNRKDDNITNGASNGTKPMDGDFVLPQRPFVDGSLNAMLSDLSAVEWIEDNFGVKEYPLLKSFTEAPWDFEGVYVNYNSIDSNTLLLLTFGSVTVTNIPNIKINFSFGGGDAKELVLPLMPLLV